jgi:hypothetical protein
MAASLFPDWQQSHTTSWGQKPLRIAHALHRSPLFSDAALAELIGRYPKGSYALVNTGGKNERQLWREGEIGNVPGDKVIEAIGSGRMWLNLRHVSDIDPAFKALLGQMMGELKQNVPGFDPTWASMGILISSPGARVYYHADMPGQALAQIRGSKRVYVYPATKPFLTPEGLENIACNGLEIDMHYEQAFDQQATVFDAQPGEMFHWPLNAPHRVDNHDSLNVSTTIEYLTPEIRRHQIVTAANGFMRQQLGWTPRSTSTAGAAYWSKALLQAGVRRSGILKGQQKKKRPITFALDLSAPGGIRSLPAQL